MTQEIILEAGRAERHDWLELWRYREVFRVLAWRDVTVRYKQTVIGVAWAAIRPLMTIVVFTVVFGKLANLPSEGTTPYAIMVFAGMLPWTSFPPCFRRQLHRPVPVSARPLCVADRL
jgi:lipopolysaccharide transport system permease protein